MVVSQVPVTGVEAVRQALVGLKMPRALEAMSDIVSRLENGELTALDAMVSLLSEELHTREGRRIKMALMTARMTRIKTLESFDFSFQPSLDRNQILTLAQLGFLERKEVVHFLGPPGTGKTHLALALGYEAIKAGKSVYVATLAEIIASLLKAEREGTLVRRIKYLTRAALLIIDEVGYLPLEKGGASLFFRLVSHRYERGSIMITTNKGIKDWPDLLAGDEILATAILDRLLHHSHVLNIKGRSYRLKALERAATTAG